MAVSSYDYMNGHRQIIALSSVLIVADAEKINTNGPSGIETLMVRCSQG